MTDRKYMTTETKVLAARISTWAFMLLLLGGLLFQPPLQAALPASADGQPLPSLAPMLEQTMPAVVNIATHGHVRVQEHPLLNDPFFRRFFNVPDQPRERETQSLGSGVVVDAKNGYVLTNNHVIDKADEIAVTLNDGRTLNAKLVGTDPESDVAVIQVPPEKLTALPLANSDALRVGDFVVAIGNPFGLGQTVTSGIVSGLGRSGLGIEGYEDFIQTDASINPGNSGGALVSLRGELVGINTAILSGSGGNIGIGFAIPINMARTIMEQLIEHGEVSRGRLGVDAQDLTSELAKAFNIKRHQGAVISRIVKGSPADRAGLKVGDIVTGVNGREVQKTTDLRNAVGLLRVGEKVTLKVLREGRPVTITAVIAEPQQVKLEGGKLHPRLAGAVFGSIEEGSPLYGQVEGVLVVAVEAGSPAQRTGIRPGDVILSVNRQPVRNLEELRQAARRNQRALLMNIQRGNAAMFVLIQ